MSGQLNSGVFTLDFNALRRVPPLAGLAQALSRQARIDSAASFNAFCLDACCLWPATEPDVSSSSFTRLLDRIARRDEQTIATSWGGVVITRHEPPRVEKFLVVRAGCYLALEKHAQKDEHLEVREGAGLLLRRDAPGGPLRVVPLAAGDRHHLEPGQEHCLIGTRHLLVFENSTDPKGMDQDLVFIYQPGA